MQRPRRTLLLPATARTSGLRTILAGAGAALPEQRDRTVPDRPGTTGRHPSGNHPSGRRAASGRYGFPNLHPRQHRQRFRPAGRNILLYASAARSRNGPPIPYRLHAGLYSRKPAPALAFGRTARHVADALRQRRLLPHARRPGTRLRRRRQRGIRRSGRTVCILPPGAHRRQAGIGRISRLLRRHARIGANRLPLSARPAGRRVLRRLSPSAARPPHPAGQSRKPIPPGYEKLAGTRKSETTATETRS